MKLNDRIVGIVSMIASVILFWNVKNLPLNAKGVPVALLIVVFVFGLILVFRKTGEGSVAVIGGAGRVFASIGLILAYVFLMKYIGFCIATVLFVYTFLMIARYEGKKIVALLYSIILTGVCFALFKGAFSVKLPTLFL